MKSFFERNTKRLKSGKGLGLLLQYSNSAKHINDTSRHKVKLLVVFGSFFRQRSIKGLSTNS